MPRFEMSVMVAYVETQYVDANTPDHALQLFRLGEGALVDDALEYSHQITKPAEMIKEMIRECD